MAGKVKHKLQELLHKKELEIGGRKSLAYHAKQMGVSKRSLERWLDPDKRQKRFDEPMLAAFCKYFKVEIGDILEYIPEGNDE